MNPDINDDTKPDTKTKPHEDATPAVKARPRMVVTRRARVARRLDRNEARARAAFPAQPPADIDLFRMTLARRIEMFVADRRGWWRSCREPQCRRQRGCAAPRDGCWNKPPVPPDPDGRHQARSLALLKRALRDMPRPDGDIEPGRAK